MRPAIWPVCVPPPLHSSQPTPAQPTCSSFSPALLLLPPPPPTRLVAELGEGSWSAIAAHFPGRKGKQCRERWHNQLRPDIRRDAWAPEEERALIAAHRLEDNFYVVDLGALQRLHGAWGEQLPRVTPFDAVKCNPDPAVLATLAALGAGFDCASAAELDLVLGLGVPTARVVYAHPCKPPPEVRGRRMSMV